MLSRVGWGATATGAVRRMQPDSASAVMAAMIGRRNARATRTGAIPQSETALVLHLLWLTNGGWTTSPRIRPRQGLRRDKRGEWQRFKASGRVDAAADRAGHAGATEAAIARRVLGEILLMIVLGEIERTGGCDLGSDRAEALCGKRLLVGRLRSVGSFLLRVAEGVDRRAILRADVVALAHAL